MSERYEITFTEGGVGAFETIITGGIAKAVEKTLDTLSGDENHGWYCEIKDTLTEVKVRCWGITKAEAQEKAQSEIKEKNDDLEDEQERERRDSEKENSKLLKRLQEKGTNSPSESDNSDFATSIGKFIGYIAVIGLVVFVVIWLAVNVVIPVVLLNSALLFAVLAVIFKKQKTLFAIFSLIGAAYMLLDIFNGWFSANFVEKVVKNPDWITAFVYINSVAVGFCTWVLIQPVWYNARKTICDKRKSAFLMGIVIFMISLGTISAPIVYLLFKNNLATKNQAIKTYSNLDHYVLKKGLSITIGVSTYDLIYSISNYNPDRTLRAAINRSRELRKYSESDDINLFGSTIAEIDPNFKLSTLFCTNELKDRLNFNSTNQEVLKVIHQECEAATDRTINILYNRFNLLGIPKVNFTKLGILGHILIELPDSSYSEYIQKLLQVPAHLEFWETYSSSELTEYISKANELLQSAQSEKSEQENSIFVYLQQIQKNDINNNNPTIGYTAINDTEKVNQFFERNQVKAIFPRDLKLYWTSKPRINTPNKLELIALKITSRDGLSAMSGELITNATQDKETQGNYEVVMNMAPEGAEIWKNLIEKNIGRQIAIALDGYVYSTLFIEGDKKPNICKIVGTFTEKEGQLLASLINAGKLPATVSILSVKEVGN